MPLERDLWMQFITNVRAAHFQEWFLFDGLDLYPCDALCNRSTWMYFKLRIAGVYPLDEMLHVQISNDLYDDVDI